MGARVVNVKNKGYGSALQGGFAAARGKYILMGDADGSYDFITVKPGAYLDPLTGRMRAPHINLSLLGSLLPHEVVIDQTMTIQHDGKTYKAWALFKRDYDNNSELNGKPINITCRLEKPPARRGSVFGICEFE